ncbi:hypothetical protein [Tomitella biformata]|uniref:hypothetical protein n=1 Tax=Tomitella biformata TaxID=630403 RepID=UPI0004637377|nr:hypothetical protein [Tomitella biformata]
MASSNTASISFPYPPDQLHRASYDTLIEICAPASVIANVPTVTGRTAISWKTFGEDIFLQVSTGQQGSALTITSKSMLPTQVIDFGAHRRNVAKIVDALQRRLGPGQMLAPLD